MRGAKCGELSGCLFFSILAIASCGGRVEPTSAATPDASTAPPVPTTSFTPLFDAGTTTVGFDGGAPGFPPVPDGPNDTSPACASRPPLACACSGEDCPKPPDSFFAQIANDCAMNAAACGFIYADFDSDGCAVALRMDQPNPKFVACVTAQLDTQRWLCETGGGELSTYRDCTLP